MNLLWLLVFFVEREKYGYFGILTYIGLTLVLLSQQYGLGV
ncbi:hypothetical protein VAEU17_4400333 [Vibrio aestuarianus]|nr:hypothetical protein VAEU17_4400333 [Vibrio aestuarianus]